MIDVSSHKNVENVIRYFLTYLPPRGAESILDIGGGSTAPYKGVLQTRCTKYKNLDIRQGDRVEAKGNMTLSNADTTAIKLEAVSDDHIGGLATTGAQEVIMQKLGAKNQSQSFEVTGSGVSVSTESQATASLAKIDAALDQLSLFRSSFGAVENRIDASINNATTLKINTEAAKSRIQDADFAAETSKMTKSQILSQAATSMLAQANASKQNLLALLQG